MKQSMAEIFCTSGACCLFRSYNCMFKDYSWQVS